MQRIVNASRSLQILGELSSVYIPISNTPTKLPSYLAMQASSPWQVSALQAIALESMTLSSRLRSSTGGRGTLQDLEDTINSTGKRRIAKFEMSVADPDVLSEKPPNEVAPAEKVGATISRQDSEGDEQLCSFDIDTFTRDYRISDRRGEKEHIFGRAEVVRGDWDLSNNGEERDPHDRFDYGPSLQRYDATFSQLPPLLNSRVTHTCGVAHMALTTKVVRYHMRATDYNTSRRMNTNCSQVYLAVTFPATRQLPKINVRRGIWWSDKSCCPCRTHHEYGCR
jgi:hypothetical protein